MKEDIIDVTLIDNGFIDVRLETKEVFVSRMTIQKGCDFSQKLRIKDKDGNPKDISTANFIRFRVKNGANDIDLCFPKVAAVDEIQKVAFSSTPTVGTFKFSHEGNETVAIAFDDVAATIQTALRTLKSLNDVTVSGTIDDVTGLTITFVTRDGGRDQPLLLVTDSGSLKTGVTVVTVTVTEDTKGIGEHGIDILNGVTGLIEVLGSELEAGLYADGLGADATLKIRDGAEDLPIEKFTKFLDVIAAI